MTKEQILDTIKHNWFKATAKLFFTKSLLCQMHNITGVSLDDDYLNSKLPISKPQDQTTYDLEEVSEELLEEEKQAPVLVYYLIKQMQEHADTRFEYEKKALPKSCRSIDYPSYFEEKGLIYAQEQSREIEITKANFDTLSTEQKHQIKFQREVGIENNLYRFQTTKMIKDKADNLEMDNNILQNIWDALNPIPTHALFAELSIGIENFII